MDDGWIEVKPKKKIDKRKTVQENKNISVLDKLLKIDNFYLIRKNKDLLIETKKLLKLHNNDITSVIIIIRNHIKTVGSKWNVLK